MFLSRPVRRGLIPLHTVSGAPFLSESPPLSDVERLAALVSSVEGVFLGKTEVVRHLVTAVIAGGHVLLEDVPGVGKTTVAQAMAQALGCDFGRVQFTADLLPSDLLGVNIFDEGRGMFTFHPGPLFHQVVLADEINRTPPRTQSALLEAMNDGQVTVEGEIHPLPAPFFVVATQNPLEHHGTFPLPESQVDRFMMCLAVGYPDLGEERELLRRTAGQETALEPVLDPECVLRLRAKAREVRVHEDIEDYILGLVRRSREEVDVLVGASPRAGQALVRAARARAMVLGRDFVVPDDVQAVAEPVLAHRVLLSTEASGEASSSGARLVRRLLGAVPAPR